MAENTMNPHIQELRRFLSAHDYDAHDPTELERAIVEGIEALEAVDRAKLYFPSKVNPHQVERSVPAQQETTVGAIQELEAFKLSRERVNYGKTFTATSGEVERRVMTALEAGIGALRQQAALVEALREMERSAVPNLNQHPAMFAAWEKARALLAQIDGRT